MSKMTRAEFLGFGGCYRASDNGAAWTCAALRPYLRYNVGTTTMFKNVDVTSPHKMTTAIGV